MICTIAIDSKVNSSNTGLFEATSKYDNMSYTAFDKVESRARELALKTMIRYIENNVKPLNGDHVFIEHI